MSRYNVPPDLLAEIKALRDRVEKLERQNVLQAAAVSQGGITIQDEGNITFVDGGALISKYDSGRYAARLGRFTTYDANLQQKNGIGLEIYHDSYPYPDFLPDYQHALFQFFKPDGSSKVIGSIDVEDLFLQGQNELRAYGNSGQSMLLLGGPIDNGNVFLFAPPNRDINLDGANLRLGGLMQLFAPGTPSTSGSANVFINASGAFFSVTSSIRYKTDIEEAVVDPMAVLKLVGKTWIDKGDLARRESEDEEVPRYVGFIAEDLDEAGLTDFVVYNDEGQPESIMYDRLSVALLEVLKMQQEQIEELSRKIDALEGT